MSKRGLCGYPGFVKAASDDLCVNYCPLAWSGDEQGRAAEGARRRFVDDARTALGAESAVEVALDGGGDGVHDLI
jgi:hypothetical protein